MAIKRAAKKPVGLDEWYVGEPEDAGRWSRDQLNFMPRAQLVDVLLNDNFEDDDLKDASDEEMIEWYMDVEPIDGDDVPDAGPNNDATDAPDGDTDDTDDTDDANDPEDDDDDSDPDFYGAEKWVATVQPLLLAIDAGVLDPYIRDIALACRNRHFSILGESEPTNDDKPAPYAVGNSYPPARGRASVASVDPHPTTMAEQVRIGMEMAPAELAMVVSINDRPIPPEDTSGTRRYTNDVILGGWRYKKAKLINQYFRIPDTWDAPGAARGCMAKIVSVGTKRIAFKLVERPKKVRTDSALRRMMANEWSQPFYEWDSLFGSTRVNN